MASPIRIRRIYRRALRIGNVAVSNTNFGSIVDLDDWRVRRDLQNHKGLWIECDFLHTPNGVANRNVFENMDMLDASGTSATAFLTAGKTLFTKIDLPAGFTVTNLTYQVGATMTTGTHTYASLWKVIGSGNVKATATGAVSAGVLTVDSTAGFPATGTLSVFTSATDATPVSGGALTYTGITATTFTGVTGSVTTTATSVVTPGVNAVAVAISADNTTASGGLSAGVSNYTLFSTGTTKYVTENATTYYAGISAQVTASVSLVGAPVPAKLTAQSAYPPVWVETTAARTTPFTIGAAAGTVALNDLNLTSPATVPYVRVS